MASSTSAASTRRRPTATEPLPALPLAAYWRAHLPRYAGELIGTCLLVLVCAGVNVANAAGDGVVTLVGVAIANGLIVTALIYALGHLTGAHFNPAVSLAFAVGRHFPLRDLLPYWLMQFAGAALAGGTLRFLWGEVVRAGANQPGLTDERAFVLEVLLSFTLMFVITAVATDSRAVGQAAALAIGFTVLLNILYGGPGSGASMNPARSFGPALASGAWAHQWLYFTAPPLGAVLGVLAYEAIRKANKV